MAQGANAADTVDDLRAYEKFDASTCITSTQYTKADQIYPERLGLSIPYQGQSFEVELTANRDLFAPDWREVDEHGNVLNDDVESVMCHYTGVVKGLPGSVATFSLCDKEGIVGTIATNDAEYEVRPADLDGVKNNNVGHVIYNMEDLIIRDDVHYGDVVAGFEENMRQAMNESFPDGVNAARSYNMRLVVGRDSLSTGINAGTVTNEMARRYSNTNWGSGNSLRVQLGETVNANFGSGTPTSNLNSYLPAVASWKSSNRASSDNVQGYTCYNSGGTIGLAYVGTMCQSANSVGINNVCFSSSNSQRGILVAHEAGHNFAMNHDNSVVNVMTSAINPSADVFSSNTVNEFLSRSPKSCL